jgi:hypothetical protein
MQIKTAMVGNAEGGELWKCDVIEHEGDLWLVPTWLENKDEGWMTPARIVRLTGLQFQTTAEGSWMGDYVLNEPIPKSLFEGRPPEQGEKYVVVERPDIRVSTGSA